MNSSKSLQQQDVYPFEMGSWWIDDVGELQAADSVDGSFDAVFLRHLGLVNLSVTGAGIKIKWDTQFVQPPALSAVKNRLLACRGQIPVTLEVCFHGWIDDCSLHPRQAVDRINQLLTLRDVDILHPTQIVEKDLSETENASPLIKNGFQQWRQSKGHFNEISSDMLATILPKAAIYSPDEPESDIVFSWVGSDSLVTRVYGEAWVMLALGNSYSAPQEMEEQNYVDRTTVTGEEVWKTGEPRYETVRMRIAREGVEPDWLLYDRLLIRCTRLDGRPALVCLSEPVFHEPVPLPGIP